VSPYNTPLIRFGAFEMDLNASELRRAGARIKLQPQPFKVLAMLADRAGEVVSREDIERQVWGSETHVDFDLSLNYCIKQIRSALTDDAETPQFIETLPRLGYRFIASVERCGRSQRKARAMLSVLPFGNLTGDPGQEYFADGMTEELIGQLGRLRPDRLGVIAFTSAMRYKNTTKAIDQIGSELGIDYIIEGSVRRSGNRVRIAVQLIQVSDQTHLWAEAYNHTLDDIIIIQTDVAERVATSLTLELLPASGKTRLPTATGDLIAYEAYLKGQFHWNKRTEEGLSKALRYFHVTTERAPDYVPAHVGIADVYNISAYYSNLPPGQAYERSQHSITTALRINPGCAEAYASLAYSKLLYEWDFEGAEKAFRHSQELNPNHAPAHYWYALFLAAMGRDDEALRQIGLALELDPLSLVINTHKGWVLYFARRYDNAVEQLLSTIEMDESFLAARYFLGLVYLQTRQHQDAATQFQKAAAISNDHPAPITGLARTMALSGHRKDALKILEGVEKLAVRRYVAPYYIAVSYLALGNKRKTVEWLSRAYEERSPYMSNLRRDPELDGIRSDPAFIKLSHRAGFPAERRAKQARNK
jgi:TolB-like protein/tetratricopeptide (TPR) repeat protein